MNISLMISGLLIIISFIAMLFLATVNIIGLSPMQLLNHMLTIFFFFAILLSSIAAFFYLIIKRGARL